MFKKILIATCFIFLIVSLFVTSKRHDENTTATFEVWGIFHYYTGAKYFNELGYFDLYSCALETNPAWDSIEYVRDMHSYKVVPRSELAACPREKFTPERWDEFKKDVAYFGNIADKNYFTGVFTDKGFNPPPFWAVIANPLANIIPLGGAASIVLFNLDIFAVLIAVAFIYFYQSQKSALLTLALVVFYFGTFGRIGGNFLQYFWFSLIVLAVIFWSKKKPVWSGISLGLATGLQIFPVFFGAGIVVIGIMKWFRKDDFRPHLRFILSLLITCAVCVGVGSFSARGFFTWKEWQEKISIHKNYLQGELFNIGLANLTATTLSNPESSTYTYIDDTPQTFVRIALVKQYSWIYYLLALGFLGSWLYLIMKPGASPFGFSFLLLYALLTLSPYYYLILALIPFFFWEDSKIIKRYAIFGTIILFILHTPFIMSGYITFSRQSHLISELLIFSFFLLLSIVSFISFRSKSATIQL